MMEYVDFPAAVRKISSPAFHSNDSLLLGMEISVSFSFYMQRSQLLYPLVEFLISPEALEQPTIRFSFIEYGSPLNVNVIV